MYANIRNMSPASWSHLTPLARAKEKGFNKTKHLQCTKNMNRTLSCK